MKHILTVVESRLPGLLVLVAAVADALSGSHLAQSGGVDWSVAVAALGSLGLSVKQEAAWAKTTWVSAAEPKPGAPDAEAPKA